MTNLDSPQGKALHYWPIAMLRVYTGLFFLQHGFGKLRRDNFADGLSGFVNSNLENSFGFFQPFLENVVLPNSGVFAFMVAWGEFLAGAALVLGLATRYAAVAGALMVAAFWFAKGQGFFAPQNHDSIWFVIFIVLAGVHAGRVFGLDARLSARIRLLA